MVPRAQRDDAIELRITAVRDVVRRKNSFGASRNVPRGRCLDSQHARSCATQIDRWSRRQRDEISIEVSKRAWIEMVGAILLRDENRTRDELLSLGSWRIPVSKDSYVHVDMHRVIYNQSFLNLRHTSYFAENNLVLLFHSNYINVNNAAIIMSILITISLMKRR